MYNLYNYDLKLAKQAIKIALNVLKDTDSEIENDLEELLENIEKND